MTGRPIAFVALLVVATSVRAQEAPASPAVPGATARVTVPPNQRVVGTIVSIDADTLVLAQQRTTLRLPTSSVRKLEIADGHAHRPSTLIGAGLGAVVGGVLGGAVGAGSSRSPNAQYVGTMDGAAQGVVIGAAAGALLGGWVGYHRPRWRWRDASPPRVGIRSFGHGIGVRVGF